MFQLGQADGVTPGGASPSMATVETLGSDIKQATPVGAASTSPVANTVTSMTSKMLEQLITTPEQDVASSVAYGEMTSDEVADLVASGDLSTEAYAYAMESENIANASADIQSQTQNDSSNKIDDAIAAAKSKITDAADGTVEKVKNFSVPTTIDEVKNSSLSEVLKTQDTAAEAYKKNNCAASPYFECSSCKWSKTCINSDGSLKALLGSFGFLDEYTKALNRGDAEQASQMFDCPGRLREMMGEHGILGNAAGIAASVTTITATAAAGNASLFTKVSDAVKTGDLKVVARDQFTAMTGNVVEDGSTLANLKTSANDLGINTNTLTQAALPSALRSSGNQSKSITDLLGNAVDTKKVCGFNGMSTGSVSELTSASGTINKNYKSSIKQASALGFLFGNAKAPSDNHAAKIDSMLDNAYANRMK